MSKYVVNQDKQGKYYFTLLAPNGQVLATSLKYASQAACYNGIACVQKWGSTELIQDRTDENKSSK